jgi:methylated-DNA-[protein]-cysteine S-methyltransferase
MQAIAVRSDAMGNFSMLGHQGKIVALDWRPTAPALHDPPSDAPTREVLLEAKRQMDAYLAGELTRFDLPLAPRGTPFQQRVYQALLDIPLGQTRTYGELATELNSAPQPVGQACGSNPISIIIPCHRVLARHGAGGFSAPGGLDVKIRLLQHEKAWPYLL